MNNENNSNIDKDKFLSSANASNSNTEVSNMGVTKNENEVENKDNNKNHGEEKFNAIVSAVYFLAFYFPIIFLIEVVCSFIFIPFAYLAGLICSISISNKTTFKEYFIQLLIFLSWIFLGLFVCIYRYVIDLYNLCNSIFVNFDKEYNFDKKRIREFIKTTEVKEFIKFIHKRDISEKIDLMNLLRSFLIWENEKEDNKNNKTNSNYLYKASKFCEMKINNLNSTLIGIDSKNNNSSINFLTSRMYKRNIIIYEILENFVIDNELYIVDIEKMKMILPYTININKDYIKRLIYTNISNIQRALNKKKRKKNVFKENKLLNKMVGAAIRLNKVFDGENVDPLQDEEVRKKNKFDLEENEDDFYTVYNNILTNMASELKQTITKMQNKTKENEIKIRQRKKSLAPNKAEYSILNKFQ